jgi:hypothetical protein
MDKLRNVQYAEIIGEAVDPATVRYHTHSDLGNNVGAFIYNPSSLFS